MPQFPCLACWLDPRLNWMGVAKFRLSYLETRPGQHLGRPRSWRQVEDRQGQVTEQDPQPCCPLSPAYSEAPRGLRPRGGGSQDLQPQSPAADCPRPGSALCPHLAPLGARAQPALLTQLLGRGSSPGSCPCGVGPGNGTMASFFSLERRGWGTPGRPGWGQGVMLSHPAWLGPCCQPPTPTGPARPQSTWASQPPLDS